MELFFNAEPEERSEEERIISESVLDLLFVRTVTKFGQSKYS